MPRIRVLNTHSAPVLRAGHVFRPKQKQPVEVEVTEAGLKEVKACIYLDYELATEPEAPEWGTTVKAALAYVGDDAERAAEVLEAEQARGENARTSLVKALEAVIAAAEAADAVTAEKIAGGVTADQVAAGAGGGTS